MWEFLRDGNGNMIRKFDGNEIENEWRRERIATDMSGRNWE